MAKHIQTIVKANLSETVKTGGCGNANLLVNPHAKRLAPQVTKFALSKYLLSEKKSHIGYQEPT